MPIYLDASGNPIASNAYLDEAGNPIQEQPKQASAPPAAATRGMGRPSTAHGDPGFLERQMARMPLSVDQIPVSGEPIGPLPTSGAISAVKGVPGILARAAGASKVRGGANIAAAVAAAKDVPLQTPGIQAAIDEMMQYSGIENVPRVARSLGKRIASGPLSVEKARLYYPAVSRGSAAEGARLTPNMQRLLGGLKAPLNEAITAAAETVGKGEQYASGMKEYARGSKVARFASENAAPALKAALKRLLQGTALYGGYETAKHLVD